MIKINSITITSWLFLFSFCFLLCFELFGQQSAPNSKEENFILFELPIFIAAIIGCFVQESIYWFELRTEIAKGNLPVSLKSTGYWVISLISFLFFSFGTMLYFVNLDSNPNGFTVAIFAAGFPRVFKGMVSSIANKNLPLQEKQFETKGFSLRNYFFKR